MATTPNPAFETGVWTTAAFVEVEVEVVVEVPEAPEAVDSVVVAASVAVALGLLLLQNTPP